MARFELVMPKMGESIMEATIIRWVKQVGERIEPDETVLEIATDKVDSEVPSPEGGTLAEILFKENDVVPVGTVIAVLETAAAGATASAPAAAPAASNGNGVPAPVQTVLNAALAPAQAALATATLAAPAEGRFYSPLVLNIAREEGVGMDELARVPGTGAEGRVTKKDILAYVEAKKAGVVAAPALAAAPVATPVAAAPATAQGQSLTFGGGNGASPAAQPKKSYSFNGQYEIVEMDRMRKMIAENMVYSKHTSPHVTSFVEADVTNIVRWRETNKGAFEKKYGEKLTFTPLFVEALVRAILDFPMINISVDGDRIIKKKDINIGLAVALPSGNLIVPVIRNAERMNLVGITAKVNDLSARARAGKLTPDDLADGTYTLSNVGTFGNVMGTPIILQPQCAVLATGAVKKKPAVLELPDGDVIAIRHMMFLSHSYDHRVIDGALGGSFVRRVADYLEGFDASRAV